MEGMSQHHWQKISHGIHGIAGSSLVMPESYPRYAWTTYECSGEWRRTRQYPRVCKSSVQETLGHQIHLVCLSPSNVPCCN